MKKNTFGDFKRIITARLESFLGDLNYRAEVLKKRVEEIKGSGSISGYDYSKLLGEYFAAYNKAVDDSLRQLDALIMQFKQTPSEKQFVEIKELYISRFLSCLSYYQKKYTECAGNISSIETSFYIKRENMTSKISAHFFEASKVAKSQNSIDTIKICTVLGVVLTACAPVIDVVWNSIFKWGKWLIDWMVSIVWLNN